MPEARPGRAARGRDPRHLGREGGDASPQRGEESWDSCFLGVGGGAHQQSDRGGFDAGRREGDRRAGAIAEPILAQGVDHRRRGRLEIQTNGGEPARAERRLERAQVGRAQRRGHGRRIVGLWGPEDDVVPAPPRREAEAVAPGGERSLASKPVATAAAVAGIGAKSTHFTPAARRRSSDSGENPKDEDPLRRAVDRERLREGEIQRVAPLDRWCSVHAVDPHAPRALGARQIPPIGLLHERRQAVERFANREDLVELGDRALLRGEERGRAELGRQGRARRGEPAGANQR